MSSGLQLRSGDFAKGLAMVRMAGLILVLVVMVALAAADPFPAPDLKLCKMAFNATTENCCTLPYTGAPLKKFSFQPDLPVRVRPTAHLVDDAYIAKYQRAVELMRALPETDGRSFVAQYRLHCAYCDNHLHFKENKYPLEIHQTWFFLVWHRLYLYFNERILAKLIEDDTFALPYWNWDNQNATDPLPNTIPRVYALNVTLFANSINKTSSLWHPTRTPCSTTPGRIMDFQSFLGDCTPQDLIEIREQNNHLLWTQAVSAGPTPSTWHGAKYKFGDYGGSGSGTMESRPHGAVHLWTNLIQMRTFKDSASDPIFFAHHANVDRLWEHWFTLPGKYRKHLSDPDYLNAAFTFYDENGEQVSVTVKDALDLNLLRYKYQDIPNTWADQGPGHPSWKLCNPAATAADDAELLATTPLFTGPVPITTGPTTFKLKRDLDTSPSEGEEMLEIKVKNFDWHRSHLHNLFLFLPNATYVSSSIGCAEFLSNIWAIPHTGMSPDVIPEMMVRLGIRRKLEVMGRAHLKEVVVTMVGFVDEPGFDLTGARIMYSKK